MNLISTIKGSLLEGFYPAGWDLAKLDECCDNPPEMVTKRQDWWNENFIPVSCQSLEEFDTLMGHEIALQIKVAGEREEKLVLILPVGPMGMYKWVVYFLREWKVDCRHVYGFNMDEWSDRDGNTLPPDNPGAFQNAMQEAFYGPLGKLTVPGKNRYFATRETLVTYAEKIKALKAEGAKMTVIFGIGRVFHIAFWEPHFAAEFKTGE